MPLFNNYVAYKFLKPLYIQKLCIEDNTVSGTFNFYYLTSNFCVQHKILQHKDVAAQYSSAEVS